MSDRMVRSSSWLLGVAWAMVALPGCQPAGTAEEEAEEQCAQVGEACQEDADCCAGLVCGQDGFCGEEQAPEGGLTLETALTLADEEAEGALGADPLLVGILGVGIEEDGTVADTEAADNPAWGFLYVDATVVNGFQLAVYPDGQGGGTVDADEASYPLPDAHPTEPFGTYTSEDVLAWMTTAVGELQAVEHLFATETYDALAFVGVDPVDGTEDAVIGFYEEADLAFDWDNPDWVGLIRGADLAVHLDAAGGAVEGRSWEHELEEALAAATLRAEEAFDTEAVLTGIMGVGINAEGLPEATEAGDNAGWGFLFVDGTTENAIQVSVLPDGTAGGELDDSGVFPLPEGFPSNGFAEYTGQQVIDWLETAVQELEAVEGLVETETFDALVFVGVDPTDGTEDAAIAFYEEGDLAFDWTDVDWVSWIRGADVVVHLDAPSGGVEDRSFDVDLDEALAAADIEALELLGEGSLLTAVTGVWIGVDGETDELPDNPGWGFLYVDAAAENGISVGVYPGGGADPTDPFEVPVGMSTAEITRPAAEQVQQWVDTALTELGDHPTIFATGLLDVAVFVGTDPVDGTEDVLVGFYEEADQATDWSSFDWMAVRDAADAAVHLDAITGEVEFRSWD